MWSPITRLFKKRRVLSRVRPVLRILIDYSFSRWVYRHGQVIATLGACWYQLGASGAALNEELVQFLHIILQCIYQLYETDVLT
jgi:hypothetical protein